MNNKGCVSYIQGKARSVIRVGKEGFVESGGVTSRVKIVIHPGDLKTSGPINVMTRVLLSGVVLS